jgi:hypothetical protein
MQSRCNALTKANKNTDEIKNFQQFRFKLVKVDYIKGDDKRTLPMINWFKIFVKMTLGVRSKTSDAFIFGVFKSYKFKMFACESVHNSFLRKLVFTSLFCFQLSPVKSAS